MTTSFTKQYITKELSSNLFKIKKIAFRNAEIFGIYNFVDFSVHVTPFYLLITILEITFNYNVYYDVAHSQMKIIQVNIFFS